MELVYQSTLSMPGMIMWFFCFSFSRLALKDVCHSILWRSRLHVWETFYICGVRVVTWSASSIFRSERFNIVGGFMRAELRDLVLLIEFGTSMVVCRLWKIPSRRLIWVVLRVAATLTQRGKVKMRQVIRTSYDHYLALLLCLSFLVQVWGSGIPIAIVNIQDIVVYLKYGHLSLYHMITLFIQWSWKLALWLGRG